MSLSVSDRSYVKPFYANILVHILDTAIFMHTLDAAIFMHVLDAVVFMHILDVDMSSFPKQLLAVGVLADLKGSQT